MILGLRRAGKTTQIIKDCAKSGGYIVCPDRKECARIASHAKNILKLNINFPITFDDLLEGRFHPNSIKSFHIDNLDVFTKFMLFKMSKGVPIETASINLDDSDIKYFKIL